MKDNLQLKKFITESVNGTFNLLEESTFFGSKIMDIEDDIVINDNSIQYFQYYYEITDELINSAKTEERQVILDLAKNNGYQYYTVNEYEETLFIMDIVSLKDEYHTITKIEQSDIDDKLNTKWQINIKIKDILKEYLFAKIKESRTFKSLKFTNFQNNSINNSIYKYIELNLYDRYKFEKVDFFVKYINLKDNTVYNNLTLRQYDPKYNSDIESSEFKVTNINIETNNYLDLLADINLNYSQVKPSTDYKFDYYFNLYYKKI